VASGAGRSRGTGIGVVSGNIGAGRCGFRRTKEQLRVASGQPRSRKERLPGNRRAGRNGLSSMYWCWFGEHYVKSL
jgi:hypothetical protein